MTFSVDDLVSSFNASHIGQEARDLALLQAQLAQTLFAASPSAAFQHAPPHPAHPSSPRLAPTTPLARSPSFSDPFYGGAPPHSHMQDTDDAMDEDMDERMVEELLLSDDAGPSYYNNNNNNPQPALSLTTPSSTHTSHTTSSHPTSSHPTSPSSPLTASLFTSTDPFYLAQAQAAQAAHNAAARNFGALYAATGGGVFGGYTQGGSYTQNVGYPQGATTPVSPAWGETYNFKCAAAF